MIKIKEYFDDFRLYINKLFKVIKDTFIKLLAKLRSLSLRNKLLIIIGIIIVIMIIILGIFISSSYYSNVNNSSILNNRVGDFDYTDGDFNIMMYVDYGFNNYKQVYYIPDNTLYRYNSELTKCTRSCSSINDGTSECYYNYNEELKKISITSNNEVSCKFYFNEIADTDVNINVYINDINGEQEYLDNLYNKTNVIPNNGIMDGYECTNNSNINFNDNILYIDSIGRDTCDVYFTANE